MRWAAPRGVEVLFLLLLLCLLLVFLSSLLLLLAMPVSLKDRCG